MLETKVKIEYSKAVSSVGLPVIVAAAGSSLRMGGINKQFTELVGIPVLIRTLMAFERSDNISRIIVSAKKDDVAEIELLAKKYMITKLTDIVVGGASRAESIKNALEAVTEEFLLIHDGARPLVSETVIENVCKGLEKNNAVTCAVPLKDTVKVINSKNTVVETPDRASLVAVQTPQGVNVSLYKKALEKETDISKFTDDMSVMEKANETVKIVEGDYKNIKITTPEDLIVAKAYLMKEV